jgi:hypothetical protein
VEQYGGDVVGGGGDGVIAKEQGVGSGGGILMGRAPTASA